MKGAPECKRIFGFMHGVNNPELTKHLNEHVLKTMKEMMITTTAFIREVADAEWQEKKLKKQIKELMRAGKLSHLIKEIKQGKDQPKVGKKEIPAKDISSGTGGPLVIEAEIGRHMIHRMYVDGGHYHRTMVSLEDLEYEKSKREIPKEAGVHPENFKVALHLNFPDQEVANREGGCSSAKTETDGLCITPEGKLGYIRMAAVRHDREKGTIPDDKREARKLHIKARQYEFLEGVLYRRSFLKPWLRCVGPLQADYVIREIHEGSCSMHAGQRSVLLTPITTPWPLYKWGIDIADHFPKGPGKVKFLIVAIDYFTKWIEAKAVATITGNQSNGLVERANRSLGEGIKGRLGEGNKNWTEELPRVLWAHRTMIKSSHGDTPFSLTYGTKAVIPVEIRMPTYRTAAYYNARVRGVTFRPIDFVYRSNDASHAVIGGKLGPNWEGPYEVAEALGDRAYRLKSTNGEQHPPAGWQDLEEQWWARVLDSIIPCVVGGTDPMGAAHHPVLLLLLNITYVCRDGIL
ncbi:reverse transcriptase domain-containing protein [Tanacetum coccineum]